MSHDTEQELRPEQLRSLLTVSRELLQTDEPVEACRLAGQAMVDLSGASAGLLLVRGDGEQAVAFDGCGRARLAGPDHPWYGAASGILRAAPDPYGAARAPVASAVDGCWLLGLGMPAQGAIASLVAGWSGEGDAARWRERRHVLATVLELVAAALGKIQARRSLEYQVWTQHAQIADTARAHAHELARRDEAEREMRMLSLTDVLTGLNNRRGFLVQGEHLLRVARRTQARSAVVFADVDGLKKVNDKFGHAVGDRLIRDAAAVFRDAFRDADVIARLGGDEFVALTLDDARPQQILARLREKLEAFNLMQERPYRISLSAGIVPCALEGGESLLDHVLRADRQMYEQKRRRLH